MTDASESKKSGTSNELQCPVKRKKRAPPRYKISHEAGRRKVCVETAPGNYDALKKATGTKDFLFAQTLAGDLYMATGRGGAIRGDENTLNAGLSALSGMAPSDEMEAMLTAQMVAVHNAGMSTMGEAMRSKYLVVAQWKASFATKLMRTFAQQMDTLQRYRGKGEQKMTVEHVHVHAGGQAIVGNVKPTRRGRGHSKKRKEQPHAKQIGYEQPVYAQIPSMSGAHEAKHRMPVTGDD